MIYPLGMGPRKRSPSNDKTEPYHLTQAEIDALRKKARKAMAELMAEPPERPTSPKKGDSQK